MTYIVRGLTLEEIYDLSRSCRHFQYLIREENLCKMLLRDKAAYSVEAEDALQTGEYARGFRRLVKRRRATASATPYVAAVVAVADSFAFYSGWLCYLVEDRANARRDLRILDVQKATNHELVVDVPTLVSLAVPESAGCRKYTFRVLYHAAGITSCLYSFARPNTQHWLLIFNAERQQLLGAVQLESAMRLFVRNNRDHLIFGTHSERQANGIRKWALRHFDLRTGQLATESMHLTNVVGYEIGSTVCFEIIGDHFYGCSNSTAFELEEIDWTSYYYCFRFAVDDFDPERTQIMKKRDAWRRQHAEGPIDDRWTFLNFEQDEQTGSVRIIESRKEWLNGRSGSKRTYYITNAHFPDGGSTDGDGADDNDPLPNEPIARLLTSSNQPNYMVAPQRDAHAFHRGDDGSMMFSKGKTYLSTYHHVCSTYLDLVDDPLPGDVCTQRLRIRTGTRVFSNVSSVAATPQNGPSGDYWVGNPYIEESERNTIHFWPPEACCENSSDHDDKLQRLDQVMNPRGLTGMLQVAPVPKKKKVTMQQRVAIRGAMRNRTVLHLLQSRAFHLPLGKIIQWTRYLLRKWGHLGLPYKTLCILVSLGNWVLRSIETTVPGPTPSIRVSNLPLLISIPESEMPPDRGHRSPLHTSLPVGARPQEGTGVSMLHVERMGLGDVQ
ncbi:hypothetical protein JX265_004490 [Neoarthrinium moseri]|uniref:F-box domain-containing protein n=1 Tax=Neoarthrinium moseri TaxID=1658444 RepID=A0A9P9WQZ5_9PEZI|nr:hypothetical protein JX265_004490 [Neoarthrinium moseri]